MRKILITGGAGFIPSSLADKLLEDPENYVVLVDNMLTGRKENLPDASLPNYEFVQCDVNNYQDISAVMNAHRFNFVFHYAAVVGVNRTLQNPLLVLHDIEGFKNLLSLAKNTGVKRVLYASSSEVYGESVSFPQDEIVTPLNARLPYAIVKSVGESFCRSYKQMYDLDFTIFRFFNTYGSKQSPDFVVSKFIESALANEDITVFGDGQQSRTFCYIDDHVEATLNAFRNRTYMNDEVNIGNDKEATILELAETIIEVCDSKSKIQFLPPRKEGDMQRRQPNIDKMKVLLNRPLTPLRDGLIALLNDWK